MLKSLPNDTERAQFGATYPGVSFQAHLGLVTLPEV